MFISLPGGESLKNLKAVTCQVSIKTGPLANECQTPFTGDNLNNFRPTKRTFIYPPFLMLFLQNSIILDN